MVRVSVVEGESETLAYVDALHNVARHLTGTEDLVQETYGTRFLASTEAAIHPHYRERVLQASAADTVYLENLFDRGWENAPHRVLRNRTVEQWEAAGRPAFGQRPGEGEVIARSSAGAPVVRYQAYTPGAGTEGEIEELPMWVGQSVGLVSKLQPAAEIVREIVDEADTILRRLGR
jgi:NAD(P)H-dependent flavin oxidoreductase YrpB (nitropropane dioxygenase family)